ncbi:MAG: hypothetical protein WBA45_01945 [Microthrixaceae bacterium]
MDRAIAKRGVGDRRQLPMARRALMRWTSRNPALATAHSVDEFVDTRSRPAWDDQALGVLAAEAPSDEMAARTLLQALLGGLVCLGTRVAPTIPTGRRGRVDGVKPDPHLPEPAVGTRGGQRAARRPQGAAPHSSRRDGDRRR